MQVEDKRDLFAEDIFTYRARKDGKVFLFWHGKQVKILKGAAAAEFSEKVAGLNQRSAQLLMAKATGNFKRGNERR
jgi:hypothetical protein